MMQVLHDSFRECLNLLFHQIDQIAIFVIYWLKSNLKYPVLLKLQDKVIPNILGIFCGRMADEVFEQRLF